MQVIITTKGHHNGLLYDYYNKAKATLLYKVNEVVQTCNYAHPFRQDIHSKTWKDKGV